MIEAKDHHGDQLSFEKLRETPFRDGFFLVMDIFARELNAWAKNYAADALGSWATNAVQSHASSNEVP